jgi:sensor c-di-GMP phosphodiesterase-like protein
VLKSLGVRRGIDDFGPGYSSLSYLARYPFGILKIDKSFIDGIGAPGNELELTRAIIDMATVLDLEVVAEAIEREEQASQLRKPELRPRTKLPLLTTASRRSDR